MKAEALVVFLVAMLGCGAEPADDAVTNGGSEPEGKAAGIIGGEPILPRPVVLGAISNDAVEEVIDAHRDAIVACYEDERAKVPGIAGKVLIRFTIGADGKVVDVSTRSTSLRHEPTETCVEQVIAQAAFPALASGHLAIVNYPVVF
ncbi:MAG: AgmX/PglI C-terminal domain-containing protein [Deltaproteobacteria bacterium]|nr:AgmX/PglI C-terminal domain-containing protein [Deltaproteobacteria bacterium]